MKRIQKRAFAIVIVLTAVTAAAQSVQVPAGTVLLVRMVDSIDTSKTKTGQIFSATLETDLGAGDYVVAERGTPVYGKVIKSSNARRLTGKSELYIELTSIVVNGRSYPIQTGGFT